MIKINYPKKSIFLYVKNTQCDKWEGECKLEFPPVSLKSCDGGMKGKKKRKINVRGEKCHHSISELALGTISSNCCIDKLKKIHVIYSGLLFLSKWGGKKIRLSSKFQF